MAVDTSRKRFSLMGMGAPVTRVLPIPDSTFSDGDRRQFIGGYPLVAAILNGILTAAKRWSMIVLNLPFGRVIPPPDGSFANVQDRLHLEYLYALGVVGAFVPPQAPAIVVGDGGLRKRKRRLKDYSQGNLVVFVSSLFKKPF